MTEPDNEPTLADNEPHRTVESAGARLTAARRSQGLSLSDVARQLKLSVRQVEALEHDDYPTFSGAVFVRGFLRNYAKLLQLDPEELVALAIPSAVAPTEAFATQEPHAAAGGSERPRRFLMGSALVILVIVAIVLLASNASRDHQQSTASSAVPALHPPVAEATPTQPPAPAPATPSSPPAEAKQTKPEVAAGAAPQPPAPAASPAPAAPTAGSAPDTAESAAKPVVTGSGPERIKLVFAGESWVEIKDGNGNTLMSRLNAAGSERVVRGTPPFTVVVGNAPNVKVTYHDKDIDLQPHTKVDVARITLE